MSWHGGSGMVRVLVVGVAVLLPAAVVAAAAVDPRPATTVGPDGPVGATGLGQASLLDEQAAGTATTAVTVAPVASTTAPAAPSTTQPNGSSAKPTTTTTTSRANTGPTTTVSRMPAGNIPPASSWQGTGDGASAKMRMEPAVPVAGQPVRFYVEYSGVSDCCYVILDFGDGDRFALNNTWMCQGPSPLRPGSHHAVATHTYAKPGAYWADLSVLDGNLCVARPEHVPGDPMPFHHVEIQACIAVGQTAAEEGCKPRPPLYPFPPPPGVAPPTATR